MMLESELIDYSQVLTLLNVFHPHVHKKMSVTSLTQMFFTVSKNDVACTCTVCVRGESVVYLQECPSLPHTTTSITFKWLHGNYMAFGLT